MSTADGGATQAGGGILAPLTNVIARRIADERSGSAPRRDPDLVRQFVRPVASVLRYFSPEIRGFDNIPVSGPVLIVGNHSCLFYMPDTWVVALALTARRGVDTPAYALVYDLLLGTPGIGAVLRRLGGVPASGPDAERALAEGAALLVYPGGDKEACRPWTERNHIVFSGRKGFIRLALRCGVPVVPVVSHGSHQAIVIVNRGDKLARALGLSKLRIGVFPIFLGPTGFTCILAPPLPMPSAVTVEFMKPIDWSELGPDAADDEAVVDACYKEITAAMQSTLDRLAAERPHPVLDGMLHLARGGRALSSLVRSGPTTAASAAGRAASSR